MIIFPPSIINNDTDRPVIVFTSVATKAENDAYIVLPIPQALQFSDSAAYNNSELGFQGSMVLNAGRSNSASDAVSNVTGQALNAIPKSLQEAAGLLGSNLLKGEFKSAVGIATGTTLNKNIVTEFSGVSTRQFGFQFKLVSTSAQESRIIKEMIETFRKGLYPEGNSLQLRYPPTWYINFKKDGKDIEYIPRIFETYLTNMSTSYNSSLNLFHEDGSPVEVDLNITFMESRALTLDDIRNLEKEQATRSPRRTFETSAKIAGAVTDALKKATDSAQAAILPVK